jgi:hypothetical protein
MKPKFEHDEDTLQSTRASYWEFKIRPNEEVSYSDHPNYWTWTVGFRLSRDTTHGDEHAQEE